MSLSRLRKLAWAAICAGAVATLLLVILGTDADAASGAPTPLLLALWTQLPYLLLAIGAGLLARTRARLLILLAATIATIAIATTGIVYADSFLRREDAQAALIFMLLPAYQGVVVLAALLVIGVLHLRRPLSADDPD